jgi:hypothetical protein
MSTVCVPPAAVNTRSPSCRGQPSKQTVPRLRQINRALVQAVAQRLPLPSDTELAQALGVSERTVRTMRLDVLGLNRHELVAWGHGPVTPPVPVGTPRELICATPYAGLWLLVPQILTTGLACAAAGLKIAGRTRVQGVQVVLTLVAWAALGFQRLMHVDDFRHWADMGLALFTGHLHLWSDTTLWRWVHGLIPARARAFYDATVGRVASQPGSQGRFSLDEHVVPSFTKLKPRRLGKTRVPTRGRAYPAFRLYAPFDLDLGRFVGVVVKKARESLSQIVPELFMELRRLRQQAGVKSAAPVRLILDRGAYKAAVFETLMADPQVSFIAMARATKKNVVQWTTLPERLFRPYQPAGDDNPNLKIARAPTTITGCPVPLPSIIMRDDTPHTRQRWRVLFYKNPPGRAPHAETLDAEYRQRQNHEVGFAQYIHALAGHSLPKAYTMRRKPNADGEKRHTVATVQTAKSQRDVQFVAWIKFLTFNLIRDLGATLGRTPAAWRVATLVRRYLLRPGRLYLDAGHLIVQLDPFRGAEPLSAFIQQVNQQNLTLPWLSNLILQFEVGAQPQGLAAVPQRLAERILANARLAAPS